MSRRLSHVFALGCVTAVLVASAPLVASATAGRSAAPPSPRVTAATDCPPAGGAKVAEASTPNAPVKVFGHGWGHGMGMSQYGAQGAARLGCRYRTILDTYYAGTSVVTHALDGPVLLQLANMAGTARLDAE